QPQEPMSEEIVAQLLKLDAGYVVGDLAVTNLLADAHLTRREDQTHLTIIEEDHQGPGHEKSHREKDIPALIDPYIEEPPAGDDVVPNPGKVEHDDQEHQDNDNDVGPQPPEGYGCKENHQGGD